MYNPNDKSYVNENLERNNMKEKTYKLIHSSVKCYWGLLRFKYNKHGCEIYNHSRL